MLDKIDSIMDTVNKNIVKSLKYFWPEDGDKFPSERILTYELSRYFIKKTKSFFYPEISIVTADGREKRDLLIIDQSHKAIIQVEVKHLYQFDKALEDMKRVCNYKALKDTIKDKNISSQLNDYQYYGLFIGAGLNDDDKWWLSTNGKKEKEKAKKTLDYYFKEEEYKELLKYHKKRNSQRGHFSKNDSTHWLVYYFIKLK